MHLSIKKLGLVDNIAFSLFLILAIYLSYKILSQVIAHEESEIGLIFFLIIFVFTTLTFIVLVLTNQAFHKKRTGLKLYQNTYAFLLLLFLLYLDYFLFEEIRYVMDYLYLKENQIIFVIEVLFNVLTILTIALTMHLDFAKIDNQQIPDLK